MPTPPALRLRVAAASPARRCVELMVQDPVSVRAEADQEEVAQIVARYNLLAVPVLDGEDRILGVITEAWMRLQDRPTRRASASIRFAGEGAFHRGAEAVRAGHHGSGVKQARGNSWQTGRADPRATCHCLDPAARTWLDRGEASRLVRALGRGE